MSKSLKIKTRKSRTQGVLDTLSHLLGSSAWKGEKRPGGGRIGILPDLNDWRGTTRHTCAQWPFVVGSSAPIHGAQIGHHLFSQEPIGCDPITWHEEGYILNPSAFIIAKPGTGKSTLLRKMVIGCIAMGTNAIIAGDRKGEHVRLIRHMGGQVITLGPQRGTLNILDNRAALAAIARIEAECQDPELAADVIEKLESDMHSRRVSLVRGLIQIYRQSAMTGQEEGIIIAALQWLHHNETTTPILADLLRVLRAMPPEVRRVANDWKDDDEYRRIVRPLENDLAGLTTEGSELGGMFNGQTTEPVMSDRSVCFDIQGINENDKEKLAAAYIASWSAAFGMVNVSHALADAGLEDGKRYLVVVDEFWQPLAASPDMVDRINAITRLNRSYGVGTVYSTHSMSDLEAVASEADRNKARGLVGRCEIIILGGLVKDEITGGILRVTSLTKKEYDLLVSWSAARPMGVKNQKPPGLGKFIIKLGEDTGTPVKVAVTEEEEAEQLHDTDMRMRRTKRKEVMA